MKRDFSKPDRFPTRLACRTFFCAALFFISGLALAGPDQAVTGSAVERFIQMPVPFSDVLALPQETPDAVSMYGDAPQQFGELWVPDKAGPSPVAVLIHGGCWQNAFGIDHARPMSAALRAAGYVVWAIEYRRIGDPGGGWPGTFADVADAIDHLEVVLENTGISPGKTVFMGHSAGGQLALWASARASFDQDHSFHKTDSYRPDAVIGLAAITDLGIYARGESSCERSVAELIGSIEHYPGRYAAVSPVSAVPTGVPTVLVHGVEDPIVPLAQAERFEQKAQEAGEDVAVHRLDGAGHFDLIHPGTRAWSEVIAVLEDFR